MNNKWLVSFKGRNESELFNQNFVWNQGNIYIMDNHRVASWCWCRHICKTGEYNLLHIDAHYDTAKIDVTDSWFAKLPDFWDTDIETFLQYSRPSEACAGTKYPYVVYDNYLSLFIAKHPDLLRSCLFVTHGNGQDRPDMEDWNSMELYDLPDTIEHVFTCPIYNRRAQGWICNVDLDYFFCQYGRDEKKRCIEIFSLKYVDRVFSCLKEAVASQKVVVLTIALSPEWCGGWDPAEKLARRICRIMDIPFCLPPP